MDQKARLAQLEEQRRAFGIQVQRYERDFGVSSYINRAPQIADPSQLQGAQLLEDRYSLIRKLPQNGRVVEVGVDQGNFSKFILENARPESLTLIDIDHSRITPNNLELLLGRPDVQLIEGDSSASLRALPGMYDWIYVDADHGYKSVSADIDAAYTKVKVGGYLILNDFTAWSPANMMNYGVLRAAIEFLNTKPEWKVRYLALQSAGYHDLAIQRLS